MKMLNENARKNLAINFLQIAFNFTDHHYNNPIKLEYDEDKQEVKCKYLESKDGNIIFKTHLDSVESMIYDVVKQGYEGNR